MNDDYRKTSQHLAPVEHQPAESGYDLYPAFPLGPERIHAGFDELAERIASHRQVTVDGYVGVFWEDFREQLHIALRMHGLSPRWIDVSQAMKPQEEIDALAEPFLGGDDPLFGTRYTGELRDFFDADALKSLTPDENADLCVLYGCGSALANWDGLLVYVDVPKNEIQFRARAGRVSNLGHTEADDPKRMYKRFYFVDWIVLNRHKHKLMPAIQMFVDGQRPDEPTFAEGRHLRAGLEKMGRNFFRVRPWFEPGPWGGQWLKERVDGLAQEAPNSAWSFELIVPENGLMFQSQGKLLEVSFDCVMFMAAREVLGYAADRFGVEFPIRFDYLDTFDGGNLSVQCHPRTEYIKEHFGENFTQDECYYLLDAKEGARVYLGFNEGLDPDAFRAELERSQREGVEIDIERFVNTQAAHKHDLFLIPNGTIHCSGRDCMVLEISATPYIFTFKMYDWMRRDLDGNLRPLNTDRAFENLFLERQGKELIERELVSHPRLLEEGEDWKLVHLPTHPEHFYDVHRYEFEGTIRVKTEGSANVMMLVEGERVLLETKEGMKQRFNYAETFVVPAAAESCTLTHEGEGTAKVVRVFIKPDKGGEA